MLIRMLDRLLAIPRSIGKLCEWVLNRFAKANVYELNKGIIVRHTGRFFQDRVAVAEVDEWWQVHEMLWDIVTIKTSDDVARRWLDDDGSLIKILRTCASTKEIKTPIR